MFNASNLDDDNKRPGCALYRTVRANFILKGTSLNAWCLSNGVTREWAAQCLTGRRTGVAAESLILRLKAASV